MPKGKRPAKIPKGTAGVNKSTETAKKIGGDGHVKVGVGRSGPPTVTKTTRGQSGKKAT